MSSNSGSSVTTYISTTVGATGYSLSGTGSILATGLTINGPKNFISPHPLDPSKEIRYASVEAPTVDVYFRGTATLTNLVVELLKLQTGISVAQVAYRGDNFSVSDVIAGHVQAMFSNSPVSLPHVAAGRLHALAVTSPNRSPAAPELPTMIEAGVPGFQAVVWQGFSAPAGTPQPIVDRLNTAARQALQATDVMGRFKE